jgi:hypothetical protein
MKVGDGGERADQEDNRHSEDACCCHTKKRSVVEDDNETDADVILVMEVDGFRCV